MKEVDNLGCGSCKFFNKGCKRVDHDNVEFGTSVFNDTRKHHIICSDFCPSETYVQICKDWDGFDEFWSLYVEQWLPYGNTNKLIPFIVNGNTSVRYMVPLLDFVYGRMYDGDRLLAVEKMYYTRTRQGFGYRLLRIPIQGVKLSDKNVE